MNCVEIISFKSRFGTLREWMFLDDPNLVVLRAHDVCDTSYETDTKGRQIAWDCDGGPYIREGTLYPYGYKEGYFRVAEIIKEDYNIENVRKIVDVYLKVEPCI